jgi:hypothetical protein
MPASQAGRRGFEPRLPLHVFNSLGTPKVHGFNAFNALSSPTTSRSRLEGAATPSRQISNSSRCLCFVEPQKSSAPRFVSLLQSGFQLPDRGEPGRKVTDGIFVLVYIDCVPHLSRARVCIDAGLLCFSGEGPVGSQNAIRRAVHGQQVCCCAVTSPAPVGLDLRISRRLSEDYGIVSGSPVLDCG